MKKIFVAGHRGLVGGAILRELTDGLNPEDSILTAGRQVLDLRNQAATFEFFARERPQEVYLAAATVGGIRANQQQPGDFLRDNLLIQTNVLDAAVASDVEKVLLFGSSCIYPRDAAQPIKEEALLTGPLEPTNQWYALAKIAGIKLGQAYRLQCGLKVIAAMPCNLYGPDDNFDLETSHVLPALIRRFHEAKLAGDESVTLWGTGQPRREFLHVRDLAAAAVMLMARYDDIEPVNVGSGTDVSIWELAELVKTIVGFEGGITWDVFQPDGTPRKLLDSSRIAAMGWAPKIQLIDGIATTYRWLAGEPSI